MFGPSHSRYAPAISKASASELYIPRSHRQGETSSPKLSIDKMLRGRCGLRTTKQIFSANNEQGSMKRGKKWSPENSENFRVQNYSVPSHARSRYVPLKAELPHPSSCKIKNMLACESSTRAPLCPESGTTVPLNWNEPVIRCACML